MSGEAGHNVTTYEIREEHTWHHPPDLSRLTLGALSVSITLRDSFTPAVQRARAAFERFSRVVVGINRQRRSGHRHRGTEGWRLRFVSPVRAPLGERTLAKRRLLRLPPRARAAQRAYDRAYSYALATRRVDAWRLAGSGSAIVLDDALRARLRDSAE